jgi:DNA-binding XRE family transcriptional regulator
VRKHDYFCTVHRVWYAQDCPHCVDEAQFRATVIYLDGEPRTPADVIRRARRVSGMSRSRLAYAANIGHTPIYKWEVDGTMPRVDLFLRTMNACGYRVTVERINGEK